MKEWFDQSIKNITRYGDTDIFPFPIENHLFFDCEESIKKILNDIYKDEKGHIASIPPHHITLSIPVSYTGFRWTTQLDPIWNAYYLSLVLSIAPKIEEQRLSKDKNIIFSYRYEPNKEDGNIFDKNISWVQFMEQSIKNANNSKFVVACDISEFYSRIGHHQLENDLQRLNLPKSDTPKRIMDFLSNYSNRRSYGLPVGGPASRILSELSLSRIDKLLYDNQYKFCRFADDFHFFIDSKEDAYKALIFLSEKLHGNLGLTLQKSKTRIMPSSEFIATSPITLDNQGGGEKKENIDSIRKFLRFQLHFDPYSITADGDYESLRKELSKFDIIELLRGELAKSRVHITLAKKLTKAVKFLNPKQQNSAVLSMLENMDLLYPILPSVMLLFKETLGDLETTTKKEIHDKLCSLVKNNSHIISSDINLSFTLRVLSLCHSESTTAIMTRLFNDTTINDLVKKDIILIMAKNEEHAFLGDILQRYASFTSPLRAALVISSYELGDQGSHWRDSTKKLFSPVELSLVKWVCDKNRQDG